MRFRVEPWGPGQATQPLSCGFLLWKGVLLDAQGCGDRRETSVRTRPALLHLRVPLKEPSQEPSTGHRVTGG